MTVSWYIVSEEGGLLLDGFSMESTNSCWYPLRIMSSLLNLIVEILLILTYNLGSTDQTMNDSTFHVMWAVRLEVQIMTCMSMLPVHFRGQFRIPRHKEEVQGGKSIITSNLHFEFDDRSKAVARVKKFLKS
jgi:hypothetical protein